MCLRKIDVLYVRNPAVSVVIPTNVNGNIVTQAYFALPLLIIKEVPMVSAIVPTTDSLFQTSARLFDTVPV